jgi:hypothetical protein
MRDHRDPNKEVKVNAPGSTRKQINIEANEAARKAKAERLAKAAAESRSTPRKGGKPEDAQKLAEGRQKKKEQRKKDIKASQAKIAKDKKEKLEKIGLPVVNRGRKGKSPEKIAKLREAKDKKTREKQTRKGRPQTGRLR